MANGNTEEKKHYQRLGVVPISIDNIKRLIKTNIKNTINCWKNDINIDRQTFKITGPAGIGKTEIVIQLANELSKELDIKFDTFTIPAAVLSRDDVLCPFPIIDDTTSKFKMLYSDFVPYGEDSFGIFIIDEFSRGDFNFQQLCWQIQNEQRLHTYKFPKGWFIVCLDNPDDKEYSLNMIEDAAGLRRVLHLYSEVNAQAFLNHAVEVNFHPLVIEYIQIHPDYLYDFDAQKNGMIYANPASWKRVSNILLGYGNEIEKNLDDLTTLIGGILNMNMTRMFINFIKDRKEISPRDVFYNYGKVKNDIKVFSDQSNNIKLGQLMDSFTTFLCSSKPDFSDKELKNISDFLLDNPPDIGVLFLSKLALLDANSEEFKYVSKIHSELVKKFPSYTKHFYEAMISANKKASKK